MKVIEILGYKRANLGKVESKKLRTAAQVPGVLYGGSEQLHFYVPMVFLRDLVYTPYAHFVDLNIEGSVYRCILQEMQFHPVSEMMLHVDFLQIFDDKKIKMQIPTAFVGKAIGVAKGGVLSKKQRKLTIAAYPKDMPSMVDIDVSDLDLGQIVRVHQIPVANYTILALPNTPVASIEIPRALRSAASKEEKKGKK
ncbi:MAG: 50S ribosomal protein L25/general stress protein Ctc [Candidatus Cardinium sp.]|uniref:50S ribosomal protein L25/general stress protein Ctc n=1 Tax=Candidatus Cardinium sp. TP TaxID=2961955 RepID=UPI0021B06A1D|nr:50S ribosomal protein L25/general stress protein Ctc [Candidatus Cardinium sp. TP]MCT4696997.1 50S ribosomal protein L25/general stress protein Ctc [Candidatus Cardinium sp. TP]MDN5247495.1 50S ribosomal protein L25/general stress protein Ctc [Candidatus Cardinium sp.]